MPEISYTVVGPVTKRVTRPVNQHRKQPKKRGPGGGGASSLLTDLVAWWTLDGNANTTRPDSHTNGYDLSDALGGIASAAGKVSSAAVGSDGSSERLTIAHASSPLLNFQDADFTVSTWIRATTLSSGQIVFTKWLIGGYQLMVDASSNLSWMVASATASTAALSTATWYHILCEHDATNNLIGISVNNAAAVTAALTGGALTSDPIPVPFDVCGSSGGAFGFNGLVDETSVWSRLLTSDEKAAVYNSGSGIGYPG